MKNHHVLITGASTGIGLATAEKLLVEGYSVWAGVRNPRSLDELKKIYEDQLQVLKLDVSSEDDVNQALQVINLQKNGDQLTLINNAGISGGGPLETIPIKTWRALFDVNVFGLVQMTQAFLPTLRKKRGMVINIGSIAGHLASPYLSSYSASKFAVRGLSDSLRRELLPLGVKVVLVEPGPIKTPIWKKSTASSLGDQASMTEEQKSTYDAAIVKVLQTVESVENDAIPVQDVANLIHEILQSKNPRPYYLIGKNIHLYAWIARLMPVRLLDKILVKRGFK